MTGEAIMKRSLAEVQLARLVNFTIIIISATVSPTIHVYTVVQMPIPVDRKKNFQLLSGS